MKDESSDPVAKTVQFKPWTLPSLSTEPPCCHNAEVFLTRTDLCHCKDIHVLTQVGNCLAFESLCLVFNTTKW